MTIKRSKPFMDNYLPEQEEPIVQADHLDVCDTQGGMGFFNLEEIPANGVRSIDVFNGKGRKLFSVSVSTNGVAYQVLPQGEDEVIYTITEDEV